MRSGGQGKTAGTTATKAWLGEGRRREWRTEGDAIPVRSAWPVRPAEPLNLRSSGVLQVATPRSRLGTRGEMEQKPIAYHAQLGDVLLAVYRYTLTQGVSNRGQRAAAGISHG